MNPHNWQDFGDFVADAGLGLLLSALLLGLWAGFHWLANQP